MVTDEEIEEYFELFKGVDLENNPGARAQKLMIDLLLEIRDILWEIKGKSEH